MAQLLYRSRFLTWGSILTLVLLTVGVASAHPKFKSSVPAPDSTVTAAPTQVTVTVTNHDPLKAEGSLLKVTDSKGTVVDLGDTALDKNDPDRKTLVVSLKSGLANGTYTVHWKAISSGDDSVGEGDFVFGVGEAPTRPGRLPSTSDGAALPWMLLPAALLLIAWGALVRSRAMYHGRR